ncbi:hypothetical protein [Clostridium algoriphilum]|nr:hypothetical protein [Clostridium algoriphilum]
MVNDMVSTKKTMYLTCLRIFVGKFDKNKIIKDGKDTNATK